MNDPVLSSEALRLLTASRWAIPVLALLSREQGSRFAVIERRFGLSRHSLTRTLAYLREQGWVTPNPGYGHPLRPEYVLTDAGRVLGAACERIEDARTRLGLDAPDLSRWTLPVAARLGADWTRFGALQARLEPVTPRALSLTLQQMIGQDLVQRRLEDRFPPVPLYGLTGRGEELAVAMAG
ncbi:winged helix-turn-helix transcriptional regulator [Sphingomonas sp. BT-65]|uniref:winged helix-turn-helix transcriptional regulator n=1 Tax=Sphingomonas sp. BT-65 TaxID=2989821 RepID=UPI00223572DC|nr:winged helix-turn-helix transcriptional regulator [Sphingomonas sp. BT-65]MCW4461604.1 winged helix-turn-helix transcriptional regulator [Sphingomonas sp. BT-65]